MTWRSQTGTDHLGLQLSWDGPESTCGRLCLIIQPSVGQEDEVGRNTS